jgi:hypothetical protein
MNINQAFPSKYVTAGDLQGRDVPVQIGRVEIEEVGDDEDQRPVMYFTGMKKGMVLNKTNATTISGLYTEETNNWIGKGIVIYPSTTNYGGKEVDCIRVRKTPPSSQVVAPPAPPPPTTPAPTSGVSF